MLMTFYNLLIRFANLFSPIYHRVFTFSNISKVFIIFLVGYFSRALVNHIWDINVLLDFNNPFSLLYYLAFSIFVVSLNAIFSLFEPYTIPFSLSLSHYFTEFVNLFNSIPKVNLEALKVSSIRKVVHYFNYLQTRHTHWSMPIHQYMDSLHKTPMFGLGDGHHDHHLDHKHTLEAKGFTCHKKELQHNPSGARNGVGRGLRHHGGNRDLRELNNRSGVANITNQTQPITQTQSQPVPIRPVRPIRHTDSQLHAQSLPTRQLQPQPNTHSGSKAQTSYKASSQDPQTQSQPLSQDRQTTLVRTKKHIHISNSNKLKVPDLLSNPGITKERQRSLTPVSDRSAMFDGFISDGDKIILKNKRVVSSNTLEMPPTSRISGLTTLSTMTPISDNTTTNSNISNVAVVGLNDPNRDSVNYDMRRRLIKHNVAQAINDAKQDGFSSKEVVIPKKGLMGRLKLGFNYSNVNGVSNLHDMYIKYHDKGKRQLFWTIWERRKDNYESYKDFKNSWDPKTKIWKEIKKETHSDVAPQTISDLIRINRAFETDKVNSSKKGYIEDSRLIKRTISKRDISKPILP